MASISFPHGGPTSAPAASSSSAHDMDYFPNSFEASPTSGFQMNPLSSHPPRTRTSIIHDSEIYGTDIFSTQNDTPEQVQLDGDDDSVDGDEKTREEVKSRVRKEEVWKELLVTANGRDKTFKLMQYSLRLYLLFHSTAASSRLLGSEKRPHWEAALVKRFGIAISGFSLTRKLLITFNWLGPLSSILAQNSSDPFPADSGSKAKTKPLLHTLLHTPPPVLLDLINAVSDDIHTFSMLGLVGRKTGNRAGDFADWCWFLSTLVNLVENSVERGVILNLQHQVEGRLYAESMSGATTKSNPSASKVDHRELERLQRQDYWIQVTRLKLLMDLVFVSYNVFNLKKVKGPVQTITGLASAALSTAKLYDKHKTTLAKQLKY